MSKNSLQQLVFLAFMTLLNANFFAKEIPLAVTGLISMPEGTSVCLEGEVLIYFPDSFLYYTDQPAGADPSNCFVIRRENQGFP